MRDAEQLFEIATAVLNQGLIASGGAMVPLFSGGHDSLCATFLASQSRWFDGNVYHIDTGIGSQYTRRFVEETCDKMGWNLRVFKSPATYEIFIRKLGFPGPGAHRFTYNLLKDRCVSRIMRGGPKALITGCRAGESVRRMGHVEPVKVGEVSKKSGKKSRRNRVWTSPCHDWSSSEQAVFMDYFGLPRNRLKTVLGMSGECFCGAFAAPGEREAIREHAPDVDAEITRLEAIARECGTPCIWGIRPHSQGSEVALTGPMCSSCDRRASAAGIIVVDTSQIILPEKGAFSK